MIFGKYPNLGTLEIFQKFFLSKFVFFSQNFIFGKNVFSDKFIFREFFIAFKTITLY